MVDVGKTILLSVEECKDLSGWKPELTARHLLSPDVAAEGLCGLQPLPVENDTPSQGLGTNKSY